MRCHSVSPLTAALLGAVVTNCATPPTGSPTDLLDPYVLRNVTVVNVEDGSRVRRS